MSTKDNVSIVRDNFCKHLTWKPRDPTKKVATKKVACDCSSIDVQDDPNSKIKPSGTVRQKELKDIYIKRGTQPDGIWANQPKKVKNALNTLGIAKESCWDCCDSHNKDLQEAEKFKQRVKTNEDLYTRGWAINTTSPFDKKYDSKNKLNIFCNWDGYYAPWNKRYLHKRADAYVCGCDPARGGCSDTDEGDYGRSFQNNGKWQQLYHQHAGWPGRRGCPPDVHESWNTRDCWGGIHAPQQPKFYSKGPGRSKLNADGKPTGEHEADGISLSGVWREGMANYGGYPVKDKYSQHKVYTHRNHIKDKLKVFYINPLSGDDNFGDGSIYNPYKSVDSMKQKHIEIDYIIKEDGDDENGLGTEQKPYKSLDRIRNEIRGQNKVIFNVIVYLPKDYKLVEGAFIVALVLGVTAAAGLVVESASEVPQHQTADHTPWGKCWPVKNKVDEAKLQKTFYSNENTIKKGDLGTGAFAKKIGLNRGRITRGNEGEGGSEILSNIANGTPIAGADAKKQSRQTRTPFSPARHVTSVVNDPNVMSCPTFGSGGGLEGEVAKSLGIEGCKDGCSSSPRDIIQDVRYAGIDSESPRTGHPRAKSRTSWDNIRILSDVPDTNRVRLCQRPDWQHDPRWKMRCCLSDQSGTKKGINHSEIESQTCPKDYCHSYIPWAAIPDKEKMATAVGNGGGLSTGGVITSQTDPLTPSNKPQAGMYRVMTKECHENFKNTCLESWGTSKAEEVIGGHFFGGSTTWRCAPKCVPSEGIVTDCGPECIKKRQTYDKKYGGDVSPISSMCRTWAFIQPRVFNSDVAPLVCKLPSKRYIESIYTTLQANTEAGKIARTKIQKRLEFPLCRDYWKRNFETFKPALTEICSYMFKLPITSTLHEDPVYGWRPEYNGKFGEMLHKAQACGCHLPYALRKARLEKEFKGHMKPMIAFKLQQNAMCADSSCKTFGLGAPQSYLNVVDRCMCNLNVQICDQRIKDTKQKEKQVVSGPSWLQKKPQINVQVCKFDKSAAGISSDDWTAMEQCGVSRGELTAMHKHQAELLKEVKDKAATGAVATTSGPIIPKNIVQIREPSKTKPPTKDPDDISDTDDPDDISDTNIDMLKIAGQILLVICVVGVVFLLFDFLRGQTNVSQRYVVAD
jgi:hypothetical protein